MATLALSSARAFTLAVTVLTAARWPGLPASVSAKESDQDSYRHSLQKGVVGHRPDCLCTCLQISLTGWPVQRSGCWRALGRTGLHSDDCPCHRGAPRSRSSFTMERGPRLRSWAAFSHGRGVTPGAATEGQRVTAETGDSTLWRLARRSWQLVIRLGLGYALTTGIVSGFVLPPETFRDLSGSPHPNQCGD